MRWKGKFALGLAAALSSAAAGQAQVLTTTVQQDARPAPTARILAVSGQTVVTQAAVQDTPAPKANGATAPGKGVAAEPEATEAPELRIEGVAHAGHLPQASSDRLTGV